MRAEINLICLLYKKNVHYGTQLLIAIEWFRENKSSCLIHSLPEVELCVLLNNWSECGNITAQEIWSECVVIILAISGLNV